MRLFTLLARLPMFFLTAVACIWLTSKIGPWAAIPAWAGVIGTLCAVVAFIMHRQPPGKITVINRIAGMVLPWGYAIGRGTLFPIVLESSIRWTLLGIAIIALAPRGLASLSGFSSSPAPTTAAYQTGPVMMILLLISWLIAGAILFRLLTFVLARSGRIQPGLLAPIVGISALVVGSILLAAFGTNSGMTWLALTMTGGPILFIGGGYGVFLVIVLTIGRNARWN